MSRFSGKCDFLDNLEMRGVLDSQEKFEEFKKRSKVYVGDELLVFDTPEDLIPYYTHIISFASYNKERGRVIHLTKRSWLEIEEERYFPSTYKLRMMQKFDRFVRENGKEPVWAIPLSEREKWTPCPLGEPYFCEPKKRNGEGSKKETRFCPYMYANRKFPCMKEVRERKREEKKKEKENG